jgi:hypothetical protein
MRRILHLPNKNCENITKIICGLKFFDVYNARSAALVHNYKFIVPIF